MLYQLSYSRGDLVKQNYVKEPDSQPAGANGSTPAFLASYDR